MTFTYDTAFPNASDTIRLLIGDTISDPHVFEDEELDQLYSLNSSDFTLTAAAALRAYAASRSRQAVTLSLPGVNVTRSEVARQASELADKYEAQALQRTKTPLSASMYGSTDEYMDAILGWSDLPYYEEDRGSE